MYVHEYIKVYAQYSKSMQRTEMSAPEDEQV